MLFTLVKFFIIILSLSFFLNSNQVMANVASKSDILSHYIKVKLKSRQPPIKEEITAWSSLLKLYKKTKYKALWLNDSQETKHIEELLRNLYSSENEGLSPAYYKVSLIKNLRESVPTELQKKMNHLADLDLVLSDSYLTHASHLYAGLLDRETNQPIWFKEGYESYLIENLIKAIKSESITPHLKRLLPKDLAYQSLKKQFYLYEEIAKSGGWISLPSFPKIEPDQTSDKIPLIKQRLQAEKYFEKESNPESTRYDKGLQEIIKKYQNRNSLLVDAVIGPNTRDAMNVDVKMRACQILVNMDRIRSFPKNPGNRHIKVNIPGYYLEVIEDGEEIMQMKTIVGRKDRPSPIFSHKISYMVFNPKWFVPDSIAIKDKLPQIQKDPLYLQQNEMRLYRTTANGREEVDPLSIDWSKVDESNFNYKIVQGPGKLNALGTMKFMFPNRHSVYLHDTSHRQLFERSDRSLSSGCIRVEEPMRLATYVLDDLSQWNNDSLQSVLDGKREEQIDLRRPIPVHLTYRTAWIDKEDNNQLHFAQDIYLRDHVASRYICEPFYRRLKRAEGKKVEDFQVIKKPKIKSKVHKEETPPESSEKKKSNRVRSKYF